MMNVQGDQAPAKREKMLKKFEKAQENQVGLKLIGTHQLPVYADDVNQLGININTTKKNIEAPIGTGVEVNTEKTITRIRDRIMTHRQLMNPLKMYQSSNIWE
jgi:hypothetical protein